MKIGLLEKNTKPKYVKIQLQLERATKPRKSNNNKSLYTDCNSYEKNSYYNFSIHHMKNHRFQNFPAI